MNCASEALDEHKTHPAKPIKYSLDDSLALQLAFMTGLGDSILSLFVHLSYLNQVLVHVFWYKVSSIFTNTSVSKALEG